jgi:hypothetical protein
MILQSWLYRRTDHQVYHAINKLPASQGLRS